MESVKNQPFVRKPTKRIEIRRFAWSFPEESQACIIIWHYDRFFFYFSPNTQHSREQWPLSDVPKREQRLDFFFLLVALISRRNVFDILMRLFLWFPIENKFKLHIDWMQEPHVAERLLIYRLAFSTWLSAKSVSDSRRDPNSLYYSIRHALNWTVMHAYET